MTVKKQAISEARRVFEETVYFLPEVSKMYMETNIFLIPFKEIPMRVNKAYDMKAHDAYWKILCEVRLKYGI